MHIPDTMPTLATGSHDRGAGLMCVMNAVSYLKGDTAITDYPTCVDPMLARVAQVYNDRACTAACRLPIVDQDGYTGNDTLCREHARAVWLFGLHLMGTAELWRGPRVPEHPGRFYWQFVVDALREVRWAPEVTVACTVVDFFARYASGRLDALELVVGMRELAELINLSRYDTSRSVFVFVGVDPLADAIYRQHVLLGNCLDALRHLALDGKDPEDSGTVTAGALWSIGQLRPDFSPVGVPVDVWANGVLDRWERAVDWRLPPEPAPSAADVERIVAESKVAVQG